MEGLGAAFCYGLDGRAMSREPFGVVPRRWAVVTETHTGGNGQRVGGEATRVALLPSGPVLLETKLHTPTPGPSTLTRPHLLAALSAGAGKKLTLVRHRPASVRRP